MSRMVTLLAVVASAVPLGVAQESGRPPEFEAVSIKVSPPPGIHEFTMTTMHGGVGTDDPGRIRYTNMLLINVMSQAFAVPYWRISRPNWLDELRFDITATMPPKTTKEQFRVMLQGMLADRFKLVFHTEKIEVPGFCLKLAKKGPLFQTSDNTAQEIPESTNAVNSSSSAQMPKGRHTDEDGFSWAPLHEGINLAFARGRDRVRSIGATMDEFARLLGNQLGRPVSNETGLTGKYDFTLTFERTGIGTAPPPPGMPEPEYAPGLVEALSKQLSLRLERIKATVDRVVIDHIQRLPEEN